MRSDIPPLDDEGFIVHGDGDPYRSGLFASDEGGVIDLLYRKAKSNKWYIIFFPFFELTEIIEAIEKTYYDPKTDKNKGFELSLLLDKQTALVMCYKPWMSSQQLEEVFKKAGGPNMKIEMKAENDIAFVQFSDESQDATNARWNFFAQFVDYWKKQVSGQ